MIVFKSRPARLPVFLRRAWYNGASIRSAEGMNLQQLKERWWEALLILLAILAITIFHYGTHSIHHLHHAVYRRLYYLPIVVAALRFGFWGGLSSALLSTLLYIPHGFFYTPNIDPSSDTDKIFEIVLYNAIGLVSGGLVELLRAETRRHKRTADELRVTLDRMQRIQYQLRIAERLAAIGQLTAGLAHELRNPLASIRGSAEILADDYPPAHAKHEMAQVLLTESGRLNGILDQFLAFARPQPLQRGPTDLAALVRAAVTALEGHPARDGHRIETAIADGLAPLSIDRNRMMQVLFNLGVNGLEAMERPGRLRVSLADLQREGNTWACIRFIDQGPGIADDLKEKIFNPFFTTKAAGTGLGLPISHRIVEDHGGVIEIDAAPGGGTAFSILLPRHIEFLEEGA
jgi:signal transduction histidine kinase